MIGLFASSVVTLLVLYAIGWVIAIVGAMLLGIVVMAWTIFWALISFLLSPLTVRLELGDERSANRTPKGDAGTMRGRIPGFKSFYGQIFKVF